MIPSGTITVDVRDHGALCDGVTDDSLAIQAANDAAETLATAANARAVVVYPPYVTCLCAGVIIKADQLGGRTTLRVPDGADRWMWNIKSPDVAISGFVFDGNKANQSPPSYDANYDGNCKNSIIVAYGLCTRLVIKDNVFRDTSHSAIALVDRTPFAFYQPGENHPDFQQPPATMQEIVINDNVFRNIGTMLCWAENPYSRRRIDGSEIHLNGTFTFKKNRAYSTGSITEPRPSDGQTNHGNALLVLGFERATFTDNVLHDVARVAIKTGANNTLEVERNIISEPHWAGIQTQCFRMDDVATELTGKILVRDNRFFSRQHPAQFMVCIGSTLGDNYTVYPEMQIVGNAICYKDNPARMDAIVIADRAKHRRILIQNNQFMELGRAAVGFVNTTIDTFTTELLEVVDNYMYEGLQVWANALVMVQGATGRPVRKMRVERNLTIRVTTPIDFESKGADIFILRDNVFRESRGAWNLYSKDTSKLQRVEIVSNEFDQLVHGFTADKLIVEDNINGNPAAWPY